MAETSGAKLNKNKQLSHEQTENEAESKNDLGLSLEKLSLGPKKKLLVLGLGGLLVDRVHVRNKAYVRRFRPDVTCGNFLVFKRPFCTEFLNFCFERFDVALWSSAMEHNIAGVLSSITGGKNSKLLFVWGQEKCTDSKHHCLHKERKPLFLKEMKDLWEKASFNGKYTASNTLLIDHEPHTGLLNPPNSAIFPEPYKKHNPRDTYLGPDGELMKFLNGLVDAKDVPSYVKDHRIGQPEITSSHPDWEFYSEVVQDVNNGGAESSSDEYDPYSD